MSTRRLVLALLALTLLACGCDVSWRRYRTSDYLDHQRELIARVRIRLDGIPLNDCNVCFGNRVLYNWSCAKIDESGLVHMAAPRTYAWLKEFECRTEQGKTVSHAFTFPYYTADVRTLDRAHYLGDIQIDLSPAGGALVSVGNDLKGFLAEWEARSQPRLELETKLALLKMQDNVWVEEQKTKR